MALTREQLLAKYGKYSQRLPDRVPGEVFVFSHASLEEAEEYAESNREHYGHPVSVEYDSGFNSWTTVVNLGPAIARMNGQ